MGKIQITKTKQVKCISKKSLVSILLFNGNYLQYEVPFAGEGEELDNANKIEIFSLNPNIAGIYETANGYMILFKDHSVKSITIDEYNKQLEFIMIFYQHGLDGEILYYELPVEVRSLIKKFFPSSRRFLNIDYTQNIVIDEHSIKNSSTQAAIAGFIGKSFSEIVYTDQPVKKSTCQNETLICTQLEDETIIKSESYNILHDKDFLFILDLKNTLYIIKK